MGDALAMMIRVFFDAVDRTPIIDQYLRYSGGRFRFFGGLPEKRGWVLSGADTCVSAYLRLGICVFAFAYVRICVSNLAFLRCAFCICVSHFAYLRFCVSAFLRVRVCVSCVSAFQMVCSGFFGGGAGAARDTCIIRFVLRHPSAVLRVLRAAFRCLRICVSDCALRIRLRFAFRCCASAAFPAFRVAFACVSKLRFDTLRFAFAFQGAAKVMC